MIGIYGANGFIGRHIVRRLAAKGQLTRAVSLKFEPDFSDSLCKQIEFAEADLQATIGDGVHSAGLRHGHTARFNLESGDEE